MSKGEDELGHLLRREFPTRTIIGQHHIRVKGRNLYFDYYIPSLRLAFEYDGRQHYGFVRFFHQSKYGYQKSVSADNDKRRYCSDVGINLIRFSYKDNLDEQTLRRKIQESMNAQEKESD